MQIIKYIILSLAIACSIQSTAQSTWHFVFNENEATLTSESQEKLEQFHQFASANHHKKLTVQFKYRYDDITKIATAKELFTSRKIVILRKIRGEHNENRIHQKTDISIFSKSLRYTEWNKTDIKPTQLIHVKVTLGDRSLEKSTNRPVTTSTTELKLEKPKALKNLPTDFPKDLTLVCPPNTNKANFIYRKGQNITFITNDDTEITISGTAIKHSEDGTPMMITISEAHTPSELLIKGVSTRYNTSGYVRLGNYIGFKLYAKDQEVVVEGLITLKIPARKVAHGKLMIKNNDTWRKAGEFSKLEYQNGKYYIDYSFNFVDWTGIGIGEVTQEVIYTRIINPSAFRSNTSAYAVAPYILYKDGTVVRLQYAKAEKNAEWHTRYIELPIFNDIENEGIIQDAYFRANWTTTLPVQWKLLREKIAMYSGQTTFKITQKENGKFQKTKIQRINGIKRWVYQDIEIEYQLIQYKPSLFDDVFAKKNYDYNYRSNFYPVYNTLVNVY